MTSEGLTDARNELQGMIEAGATNEEIEQWLDAYTLRRSEVIDIVRMLLDEIENYRQRLED